MMFCPPEMGNQHESVLTRKKILICLRPSREHINHDSCSEKSDKLLCSKRYKIIVGSATDRRRFMLYCRQYTEAQSI
jgi:hypothetical protein